jgi:hypothetical protein
MLHGTIGMIMVAVFVIGVLGVVFYAVFELTPFASHSDHYRDPVTHERRFADSPHLETRDEFEQRGR